MSSTVTELKTLKDFEVVWLDPLTNEPLNMLDVSMEIYHYEGPNKPKLIVPLSEPYIFTETINDTVNIGSVQPSQNIWIDIHIHLELNLIETQLDNLGCSPNDFKVPYTNHKVSIVNGYKQYALSACELAALINLQASGYTASSENGFLVLEGDFEGADARLQVGNGTFNTTVGLVKGHTHYGQDIHRITDLFVNTMDYIDLGTYVVTNVMIDDPDYKSGERYYVQYKGTDPNTSSQRVKREDFTVLEPRKTELNVSFIK